MKYQTEITHAKGVIVSEEFIKAAKSLWDSDITSFIKDVEGLYSVRMMDIADGGGSSFDSNYHSNLICRMFQTFGALRIIETELNKLKGIA